MASQTRTCPTAANNPWYNDSFVGDLAPLTNIWTLNGIYDAQVWDPLNASNYFYTAVNLGFSSIGSATVTSLSMKVYSWACGGFATFCEGRVFFGSGSIGAFTINTTGVAQELFPDPTPQDITLSLTPTTPQAALIKAAMTNSTFGIGVEFLSVDFGDTFFIDYIDFTINYTDPVASTGSTFRGRGGDRGRLLWGVR